ncbi:unnamed protein product [Sphagnum balticum]
MSLIQETDSEWLSHVLHQALQVFPLKGDSTCSLCKSFASCADCCESALCISTFCCFLRFSELLLMRWHSENKAVFSTAGQYHQGSKH